MKPKCHLSNITCMYQFILKHALSQFSLLWSYKQPASKLSITSAARGYSKSCLHYILSWLTYNKELACRLMHKLLFVNCLFWYQWLKGENGLYIGIPHCKKNLVDSLTVIFLDFPCPQYKQNESVKDCICKQYRSLWEGYSLQARCLGLQLMETFKCIYDGPSRKEPSSYLGFRITCVS